MTGKAKPTKYITGNGIILCGACAQPLAFHEGVEVCPFWEEANVTNKENYVEQSRKMGRPPRFRSVK